MNDRLSKFLWPAVHLDQALRRLAACHRAHKDLDRIPRLSTAADQDTISEWIESTVSHLGFEAIYSTPEYGQLDELLSSCGVVLIQVDLESERRFLVLLRGGKGSVTVLGLDQQVHRMKRQALRDRLVQAVEKHHLSAIEQTLKKAGIKPTDRSSVSRSLLRDRLSRKQMPGWWFLQIPVGSSLPTLLNTFGLARETVCFLIAYSLQVTLWVSSWYVIGYAGLQGHLGMGWITCWALLLLSAVPLRILTARLQGNIAVKVGVLFRRRFLNGAMSQRLDNLRRQGIGQLLGRVIEFETVELLFLSGGLTVAVALAELVLAAAILMRGGGGFPQALLLVAWLGFTTALARQYYLHRRGWTEDRLEMTHRLVEDLIGYRTRLVQENLITWNEVADRALESYLRRADRMDQSSVLLRVIPRGWLLVGLLGVAPAFVAGQQASSRLAVALGGTLLALAAFESLAVGLPHLASALIAWKKIQPLLQAKADPLPSPIFSSVSSTAQPKSNRPHSTRRPLIEACNLSFGYRREDEVIRDCQLTIHEGDRILLQGVSGGGKSTLVSLISGSRVPSAGTVLLRGLDRNTLGYVGWRDHIAAAPQFHENFVFANTLAFNLLLGRQWPPSTADLEEARQVCRELGLENLLERMPGGLFQPVGETGWQLSHGERSRLYIARALLRNSDLVILDESFSAMDPETLQYVLGCVLD
ncbi:MAG: ABC transporter ATP-binding protein, partial [Acidobacteriota bacterium]